MPICLRSVEPSQLSRGFTEYLLDGHEEDLQVGSAQNRAMIQMTVANSTLSKAMLQLVSLLRHADDIFTDLSDQCQKIFDRTVKINKRIITITENVDNLNSKDEPIRKFLFFLLLVMVCVYACMLLHTLTNLGVD